jgi:hypothetical protein
MAHLVEWPWHKYPRYIQAFDIGNHMISVFLAGLVFQTISQGTQVSDLYGVLGLAAANFVFVFGNHFLGGTVVNLVRGQSFTESDVFEFLTLFLDFMILPVGAVTALIWYYNPLPWC